MFSSPFDNDAGIKIPEEAQVIFVADMFAKDYQGGAELTTQALIDSSPFKVYTIRSKELNIQLLEEGHRCHWIFGNFTQLDPQLIPSIVANCSYSILEYDYKFCKYRSIERHYDIEGTECDCHDNMHGKMVSALMYGARSLWWMSEQQLDLYLRLFPFLKEKDNVVLSSVFDERFWLAKNMLVEKHKDTERKGWIVLGSTSWIKGASAAEQWCKDNGHEYEVLWMQPV